MLNRDPNMAPLGDLSNAQGSISGDVAMSFFELLWRGVMMGQWNVERINAKARATLGTGATTLSILVIGIVGFATVFEGNIDNLAPFAQMPVWMQGLISACVFFGVISILVSLGFATMSLRAFMVYDPIAYEDFTTNKDGVGGIDVDILEKCSPMPPEIVFEMHKAYIHRLQDLGANIDNMAQHLQRSQWFLLAGLTAIGIPLLLILGRLFAISIFGA